MSTVAVASATLAIPSLPSNAVLHSSMGAVSVQKLALCRLVTVPSLVVEREEIRSAGPSATVPTTPPVWPWNR